MSSPSIATSILAGDRLALSRLLTQVENNTPEGLAALDDLFPKTGRAHLIGVTGAPGTGKSSLVNRLAHFYRHPADNARPVNVAIVAVDPTSPFTGGAVLGDRIRMRDLAGDPGIFIRSMASRGALGGLAYSTAAVVEVFDAAGYEVIFIETVGAGQAEVDIARLAHTTLVVEAPGMGDDVQAIKAGILEIADILVVNKADRPGADQTKRALLQMLKLAHPVPKIFRHHGVGEVEEIGVTPSPSSGDAEMWIPPLVSTVAIDGTGVKELVQQINIHRDHLITTGEMVRRERVRLENTIEILLRETLISRWREQGKQSDFEALLDRVVRREVSPAQAVKLLVD